MTGPEDADGPPYGERPFVSSDRTMDDGDQEEAVAIFGSAANREGSRRAPPTGTATRLLGVAALPRQERRLVPHAGTKRESTRREAGTLRDERAGNLRYPPHQGYPVGAGFREPSLSHGRQEVEANGAHTKARDQVTRVSTK